jgi:P27 family predicted phage terminase small subunit
MALRRLMRIEVSCRRSPRLNAEVLHRSHGAILWLEAKGRHSLPTLPPPGASAPPTVADSLTKQGFAIRAQIIWAKTRLIIGRGDYHWQHEPCWYAVRKKGHWTGDRKQTTLWTISAKDQDAETVHPINGNEPIPDAAIPECPVELSPLARREWDRLVQELGKLRLLTQLDRAALAAYCGAYALWAEATEAVQKFGMMVKSPSGYPMQSPYLSVANRQTEIMMRIASESGFTPASRGRLSNAVQQEPDLFKRIEQG